MPAVTRVANFYPRSPCGERLTTLHDILKLFAFLSTLSLRRATISANNNIRVRKNFYPRSPCGERQQVRKVWLGGWAISIHALLAESDLSHRRRNMTTGISIHALLAESDPISRRPWASAGQFLSTLSLRRATESVKPAFASCMISIHALLAESDL